MSDKKFLSLRLELSPVLPAREVAVAWLSEAGFDMFETEEWGLNAHGLLEAVDRLALKEILEDLGQIAESIAAEETIAEEENWNATWESAYEPIDVEGRAVMRAPFHPAPASGLDLIIQPAMSFGTGHHPTTWLMLKALLDEELAGKRVLDMGSGTGVLGIAAWKLGAALVLCIDIEDRAKENAEENFARNGGELHRDPVEFACGGKEFIPQNGDLDWVLANINRNVLVDQFPAFDQALRPGGRIWTSGFFPTDVAHLQEHAEKLGWKKLQENTKGDWVAVCWEKL